MSAGGVRFVFGFGRCSHSPAVSRRCSTSPHRGEVLIEPLSVGGGQRTVETLGFEVERVQNAAAGEDDRVDVARRRGALNKHLPKHVRRAGFRWKKDSVARKREAAFRRLTRSSDSQIQCTESRRLGKLFGCELIQ